MFCVSIGTWATITVNRTTWCQYNSYADQENVLTIYVSEPGELAAAIAAQDFTDVQILHISARERTASLLQLTDEDKAALANVNVKTIEMMRAYVEPYTITNSNVERIILPYNWTKEQVKAVGLANTSANFEACISTNDQDKYESREGDAALIAYLNKPNTLKDAIMRTWNDTHGYAPLGNQVYNGGGDCSRLKYLTVMGNFCARDISSKGVYDENGHYVINGIADENNPTWNKNTEGGDLYTTPANDNNGALSACTEFYVIDLKDGYVPDEYATDIVVGYNGIGNTNLREVWMPEDPRFKTVPADYLNVNGSVRQICIPGNIEYIRTRAFASNSGTGRMNYIWTTGPDATAKYDNGAAFVSGDEITWKYMNNTADGNVAMTESDKNQFQYGTFTLPANLRLIERYAFSGSDCVSDVYVLNPVAPECHVDAFNCVMYVGNNTLKPEYIKDGIVTHDAYRVGAYNFVSILYYPRETTDPNIQRYTDPTREYSIATGDRDGNGSTIYYPNHSEMTYAYYQGSYGYLWKGWDDSRNWYDQSLTTGYGNGLPSTEASHKVLEEGNNTQYQDVANQRWVDNEENADIKADRSFYDVTTGQNNQFGEVTAPTGLAPYYENRYSGYNGVLYPKAKTETSKYVYVRDDNGDYVKDPSSSTTTIFRDYAGSADDALERYSRKQVLQTDGQGNIVYNPCDDGEYVQNFEWEAATEGGTHVKETVQDGYTTTNVIVEGVDTYYSDEGTTPVTPQIGTGMYISGGTEDDYTLVNPNNNGETVGGRDKYYTTSDGGQTYQESYLKFDGGQISTVYVKTDETITNYYNTTVNGNNVLKFGVAHYYSDAEGRNEVTPTITSINGNGTLYFKDSEGAYRATTTFVQGEGDYYVEYSHAPGTYYPIGDYNDQVYIDGVYYYGKEEDKYVHPEYYIPGTTYYNYQNWDNTYVIKTDGFGWHQISGAYTDYYYVSGSHIAYRAAQGEDYDVSETYYSDQSGTEATTIKLNTNYYIPNYKDVYRTAQAGDEALPHYNKNYLGTYRSVASTDDANEQRYCTVGLDYEADEDITYNVYNDYRGWHQFILNGRAYMSTVPMEPLRSFITDNDWWTICEPYDLRYSDMIKFFGVDRQGFPQKIPYLSKLMYVVRDVENKRITLMFSKNLMEYKEQFLTDNGELTGKEQFPATNELPEGRVHGIVDDNTKWKSEELAQDPIILHAGVPYLIRPNLSVDDEGNITGTRQFDIYKSANEDLYNRLKVSQDESGTVQKNLVYKGEYTVPAYVVGYDSPDAVSEGLDEDGELKITMKDGTTITYQDSKKDESNKLTYNGQKVPYRISADNKYTFVGTFYKSVMPQYSYFLGWDSQANKAAFWYSKVQDQTGWNWNNETGIICPNFNTSLEIHAATEVKDPARWILTAGTDLTSDDFAATGGAKSYTMDFGASNNFEWDEATGISELKKVSLYEDTKVYDINGVYQGSSVQNLPKGVYVVNGKKYVVK